MNTKRQNSGSHSRAEPLLPPDVKHQAPAPLEVSSATGENSNYNTIMAPRAHQADMEAQRPLKNEEMANETTAIYETRPEEQEDSLLVVEKQPYWQSAQFVELLLCLTVYVATTVFTAAQPFDTYERPIPYQYLDNVGEYVMNQEYNQEKTGSTVSPTVICIVAILVQIGLALIRHRIMGKSLYDLHATICTYLMAMSLNRLATEWIKNYVGYLRPIFYQTCVPNDDFDQCTDNNDGGRKSFPSGHASISFTGAMLLMLYIHQRWGMGHYKARMERRHCVTLSDNNVMGNAWVALRSKLVSLVGLLPLAVAGMVSASRVRTNHHFPADVVGGAVLGSSIAAFVHSLWFYSESFLDPLCPTAKVCPHCKSLNDPTPPF